jgi:signal transduction histidine kinase
MVLGVVMDALRQARRPVIAVAVAIVQVGGTILWVEVGPHHEALGVFALALLLLGPIALAVPGYPVFSCVVATASAAAYLAMGYPSVLVLAAAATALWWTVQGGQLADAALVAAAGWASAVLMSDTGSRNLDLDFAAVCATVLLLTVADSVRVRSDVARAWQRARQEARDRQAMEIRLGLTRDRQEAAAQQLSMIEVRAGVATGVMGPGADGATDGTRISFEAIGTAAAGARADLDESLRLLLGDTEPIPARAPGLEQLPALVQQWDSVGLLVTVTGVPGSLPEIVDETAFLVVREALTNVSRHSSATRADVQLVRDGDQLMVTVTDPGPARRPRTPRRNGAPPQGSGPGRGLSGLRDRVATLGGAVVAGPPRVPSATSWMVRAVLPAASVSAVDRRDVVPARIPPTSVRDGVADPGPDGPLRWGTPEPEPAPRDPWGADPGGDGPEEHPDGATARAEASGPEVSGPDLTDDMTDPDPDTDDGATTDSDGGSRSPHRTAARDPEVLPVDLELDLFELLSRRRG